MYNSAQQKEIEIKDDCIYFKGQLIASCKDFFSRMPSFFSKVYIDPVRKLVVVHDGRWWCDALTYQQFLNKNRIKIAEILSAISEKD